MSFLRHGLALAGLFVASSAMADGSPAPSGPLSLKVSQDDPAALKADAALSGAINTVETGLRLAVEADPSVVSDPLTLGAPAPRSRESFGFDAVWAASDQARLKLSLSEALAQTWSPLSLFTSNNHEVSADNQSAGMDLTLSPLSALDLTLSGAAQHNAVRDATIADAQTAPIPSLFTTDSSGGGAGLTWRAGGRLTLKLNLHVDSTSAEWSGAPAGGGGGVADTRLSYADVAPSVAGAVRLPGNGSLGLVVEHAVSPLDPNAFSSFAAVENRTPTARFGPAREWRYRLSFDRKLAGAVDLKASLVQARIESATELGPVGGGAQAPVSVSGGERREVNLSLSTGLEALGLASVTLKGSGAWRDSQVQDPFTGEWRRASAETPQTASLGFVQALADHHARWGLEGRFGGDQTLYQMSQITQVRVADSLGGFIEYLPGPFAVRLQVDGLYGGDRSATDIVYAQPRGSVANDPVTRVDARTDAAQAVRLILRKTL